MAYNTRYRVEFKECRNAESYRIEFSRSGSVRSYYILQWENAAAAGEVPFQYPGMKFHPISGAPDFDASRSGFTGTYIVQFSPYTQKYWFSFWDMETNRLGDLCDFLFGGESSANLNIYIVACATENGTSGSGRTPSVKMKAAMSNVYLYEGYPVVEPLTEVSSSGSAY